MLLQEKKITLALTEALSSEIKKTSKISHVITASCADTNDIEGMFKASSSSSVEKNLMLSV